MGGCEKAMVIINEGSARLKRTDCVGKLPCPPYSFSETGEQVPRSQP